MRHNEESYKLPHIYVSENPTHLENEEQPQTYTPSWENETYGVFQATNSNITIPWIKTPLHGGVAGITYRLYFYECWRKWGKFCGGRMGQIGLILSWYYRLHCSSMGIYGVALIRFVVVKRGVRRSTKLRFAVGCRGRVSPGGIGIIPEQQRTTTSTRHYTTK